MCGCYSQFKPSDVLGEIVRLNKASAEIFAPAARKNKRPIFTMDFKSFFTLKSDKHYFTIRFDD
jgi:hypothetical protein